MWQHNSWFVTFVNSCDETNTWERWIKTSRHIAFKKIIVYHEVPTLNYFCSNHKYFGNIIGSKHIHLNLFFFQKSKIRTWSFIEHTELHIQFSFPEIIQGIFISMLCLVRMSLCLTGRKLSETDEFQWLWEMNLIKIFQNINQYNGQLHNIIFYNLFYGFFLLEVSRSKIQDTSIQYTCKLFINEYKFV